GDAEVEGLAQRDGAVVGGDGLLQGLGRAEGLEDVALVGVGAGEVEGLADLNRRLRFGQ
ncbi:hypothetical protein ThidrDRAFT_4508, partial [Thiorhodococcus drewsii AZ1]